MKDEILGRVSMQDILDKYGIETKHSMFKCPFHGEDRHPSAKSYANSYHCFCCGSTGDTIRFVENLFNLSFKEAMQKINIDFNLGLDPHTPIDYEKLNQIKQAQFEKKKIKEKQINRYCELCDIKHTYEKILNYFKNKSITIKNWESLTMLISDFETKLFNIDNEIQILDEKLSSRI